MFACLCSSPRWQQDSKDKPIQLSLMSIIQSFGLLASHLNVGWFGHKVLKVDFKCVTVRVDTLEILNIFHNASDNAFKHVWNNKENKYSLTRLFSSTEDDSLSSSTLGHVIRVMDIFMHVSKCFVATWKQSVVPNLTFSLFLSLYLQYKCMHTYSTHSSSSTISSPPLIASAVKVTSERTEQMMSFNWRRNTLQHN